MTRAQIEQMNNINIYFEDISKDGDDWLVAGDGQLFMILRNQGEHDERFFIVGHILTELEKAIAKVKYFCK